MHDESADDVITRLGDDREDPIDPYTEHRVDGEGDEELDEEQELEERYHALVMKPDRMTWARGSGDGLPGTIFVGGRSYEVRVFSPADDKYWDSLAGAMSHEDADLWIRRSSDAHGRRETLLHEVLHAVDESAGTEAGEAVVNAWAPILLDALRRNPELVDVLCADRTEDDLQ